MVLIKTFGFDSSKNNTSAVKKISTIKKTTSRHVEKSWQFKKLHLGSQKSLNSSKTEILTWLCPKVSTFYIVWILTTQKAHLYMPRKSRQFEKGHFNMARHLDLNLDLSQLSRLHKSSFYLLVTSIEAGDACSRAKCRWASADWLSPKLVITWHGFHRDKFDKLCKTEINKMFFFDNYSRKCFLWSLIMLSFS